MKQTMLQLTSAISSRRRMRRHDWQVVALGGSLLVSLLIPRPAAAACDAFDLGACVDAAQYKFWMGIAGLGWLVNRMLLSLAYQLEVLRWWMIEQVFTTVYDTLVEAVRPGLAPLAILAITVGILAFLLLPWFGRIEVVDIRRALIWIIVAPVLLTLSGPWLADAESVRTDIGSVLFNASAAVAPGGIFGAPAGDMLAPARLYDPPVGACGGDPLQRRFPGDLQMDDMAAAMLYADAEDIHCPGREGPGQDIPDGYYRTPNPNYATDADIANLQAADRAAAINNLQRGVNRLLLGIIPSLLAVLNALVQLIFSFALVSLWASLPIGLLWVFFNETASGVTGLFRRIVAVLQASWSSSLLLGIVFAALLAAAQVGNAAAYSGLSMAGIFMTIYVLKVAVDTLLSSFQTLAQTIGTVSGLSSGAFKGTTTIVAGAAAALATGGVSALAAGASMAQTYGVATRAGGSRRYAAAAALGRLRPISRLGEVAASLGYESDVTDGLYTGRRSAHAHDGWRSVRRFTQADARKTETMLERQQHERQQPHARSTSRIGHGDGDEATAATQTTLEVPVAARLRTHPSMGRHRRLAARITRQRAPDVATPRGHAAAAPGGLPGSNGRGAHTHPSYVRRNWYRPGTQLPDGIEPPTVRMLERAAQRDQVLTVNQRGYAVLEPTPPNGPPDEAVLRTRAWAVPSVDALLLQGYTLKPEGRDLLMWQRPDGPDAAVIDMGTTTAQHLHDLPREQQALQDRGIVRYWPHGSQRLAKVRQRSGQGVGHSMVGRPARRASLHGGNQMPSPLRETEPGTTEERPLRRHRSPARVRPRQRNQPDGRQIPTAPDQDLPAEAAAEPSTQAEEI